jgi:hypothetical protein
MLRRVIQNLPIVLVIVKGGFGGEEILGMGLDMRISCQNQCLKN